MATTKKSVKKAVNTVENKAEVIEAQAEAVVSNVKAEATKAKVDVKENVNEAVEAAQAVAKRMWFAGLGVFGRSADELQSRYAKASDELQARYTQLNENGQKFVKDLVSRGEKVQDEAEVMVQEGRANIEEQIEAARSRFTTMVDVPARLQDVSDKLESLSKRFKKTA